MTLTRILGATTALAAALALQACSKDDSTPAKSAGTAPAPVSATPAPPPAQPAQAGGTDPAAINNAQAPTDQGGSAASADTTAPTTGNATADSAQAFDPALIKAQVLLARADASPGVIDGQQGTNFKHALAAYAQMNGLDSDGSLTPEIWAKLTAGAPAPVAGRYTLTAADVAGPFDPDVGEDFKKLAETKATGYARPSEMLAERFHMSEDLLKALNPGADFSKAGTALTVALPGQITVPSVDHIQVDKAKAAVRAYDASDKLIAVFPATVGSTDRPSPSGTHKVKGVAKHPTYTYDPSKLTWGPKKEGKFVLPPGPNNPVGVVWIALDAPDYGIHGTPEPKMVGKTASHGCVRLTNWDAQELSEAVKPGVVVQFLNARS